MSSHLLVTFDSRQLESRCSTGHSFVLLLPVHALGHLGLVFSWVLLALGFFTYCCQRLQGQLPVQCAGTVGGQGASCEPRDNRLQSARLRSSFRHQRVEWLNQMVKHVCPFICQFIEKLLRETTEPAVLGENATLAPSASQKWSWVNSPSESIRFMLKMWTKDKLFCTFRLLL